MTALIRLGLQLQYTDHPSLNRSDWLTLYTVVTGLADMGKVPSSIGILIWVTGLESIKQKHHLGFTYQELTQQGTFQS